MERRKNTTFIYAVALFVDIIVILVLQFNPQTFALNKRNTGILELILGGLGLFLSYVLEKERKRNNGI